MAGADGVNNSGDRPELPDFPDNVDVQRPPPTEERRTAAMGRQIPDSFAFEGLLPRRDRRLSADDATEFGIGSKTGPLPAGADAVTHKTQIFHPIPLPGGFAINVLPGLPVVGQTKQVSHFPPSPEHPNGAVQERSISFVEMPALRHKGETIVPGYKFKLGEKTHVLEPDNKSLWKRIKEKFSK